MAKYQKIARFQPYMVIFCSTETVALNWDYLRDVGYSYSQAYCGKSIRTRLYRVYCISLLQEAPRAYKGYT